MDTLNNIDLNHIPAHVAIIMDGNGRWAQARGMERSAGHVQGVTTVRRITEEASRLGVRYLTLYTFSTENWNRPKEEVDALMTLIVTAIERETPDLIKNNVQLRSIGDLDRMPEFARQRLQNCMDDTSHCSGLTLVLALSYSSRWEIIRAVRNIAQDVKDGKYNTNEISEELFSNKLSTYFMPDPDLLIRTGGDMRISNFLLWELAYTEIIVTPTFWPDFSKDDFRKALSQYSHRQRRFGLTGDQVDAAAGRPDAL